MNNIEEIRKSIKTIVKYPHAFGYVEFGDRGNDCTGHLDKMNSEQTREYAQTYAAVLEAIPKYSALHRELAPVLAQELELKQWPRYDYMVKLLTRILTDMTSSESVEELVRLATRAQEYMEATGKSTLESTDLANIM